MRYSIEEYRQVILYHKGEIPGRHGVGFLIKKELKNSIVEIIGVSDRIAILNIRIPPSKEVWSIVQIYSPTEQSSTSDIDLFYSILNTALKEHTYKNCIVMGDFNAQVGDRRNGENVLGPNCSGKRSRNGQKLIEMAFENNMKIINSLFKKRTSRRWTWISPDGRYKNEIDYFLTNKPKSFDDCGTIANLNFNSNHRMIRARMNITSNLRQSRPFKIKVSVTANKARTATIKESVKTMTDRSLQHLDTQQKYNTLHKILTAKSETKMKTKLQDNRYVSGKVKELLEKRSKLISTVNKTKITRKQIGEISKDVKHQMRRDRERLRLDIFEKHIIKTGGIKKALKFLSVKTNWIPTMKDQSNMANTKRSDIQSIATKFYENLYSSKNPIDNTELNNTDSVPRILVKEVLKAIESQKKDKAPGPDGINNDMLLECKNDIAVPLTNIFNDILQTEKIPTQWTTSTIILLHKKGDRGDINNYRPISLMSNIYKVFAKVILRRINRILDENQPKEQAGFRSGYSTLDHILTVRQVFEKNKEFKVPFYCCFIDYNKAFDSIEHESIWDCLKNQGVEQKYIRILKNIYTSSTARIKLEKEGEEIKINRGVRQGDPLSSKLFIAVLEDIFRKLDWVHYGLNINGEQLTHLRFADDIILFATTVDNLQSMLVDLERESRRVGLTMNLSKTKVMTNASADTIVIVNKSIEYVKEYTYLGQQISMTDIMSKEIDTRIGKAWKCYWGLKEVMKNREISMTVKTKLYNTCILPVLTYGCQTWALTKEQNKKLKTCQTAMERSMLSIRKSDRITIKSIRKRTKIEDVTTRIRKLKWKWAGHIIRGVEKWNQSIVYWYPRNRKRKRGRQFRRWEDEIKLIAGKTWTRIAQNRTEWKEMEEAFAKLGQTDLLPVSQTHQSL